VATATLGSAGYTTSIVSGGHQLVADEPASSGGADAGPTPMGLLLSGLASCTAITLRMYAERKGWALTGVEVATRVVDDGHIDRLITVSGELDAEQLRRLGEIAARTPVTRIVTEGREVRTTVR
jgi:putative redox protein